MKCILSFFLLFWSIGLSFGQDLKPEQKCNFSIYNKKLLETDPTYKLELESIEKLLLEKRASLTNNNGKNGNSLASTPSPGVSSPATEKIYRIPVVVHVLHRGEPIGQGINISDDHIREILKQSSQNYRKTINTTGFGNGFDTNVEFALAVRDPNGNLTNGIERIDMSSNASYMALGLNANFNLDNLVDNNLYPKNKYMNIWIVSGADGSNWVAFGGGGIVCVSAYVFNLHGVVTHELGHEMSLAHTFQGETTNPDGSYGCPPIETNPYAEGDFCGDTPRHTEFAQTCGATVQNPCYVGDITQVDDLYETNYMAYGRCGKGNYGMFSNDQKARIRAKAEYRAINYSYYNQLVPSGLPVVNFFALNTVSTDINTPISFFEKSAGVPNTNVPESEWPNIQFAWEFKNGSTIYTSTKQNPVMTLSVPGYYDVTLTITTPLGSSTSTIQQYIFVQSQTITPVCGIDLIEGAYYHSLNTVKFNTIYKETRIDFSDIYLDLKATNNTIVTAGQTYPLSLNVRGETSLLQNVKAYIDYNDNGSFEDGELIFKGLSTSDFQFFTANVAIPITAIRNKLLTMRVMAYSGDGSNNCGRISNPDVEDYGIVIRGDCTTDEIEFSTNNIVGYAGTTIQFHDNSCVSNQSFVNTTSYKWTFSNGSVTYSSTKQHPSITFLQLGVYDVSLTITTPSGTQTLTKQNLIKITESARAVCTTFTGSIGYWLYRSVSKVVFNAINKETSTRINEGYKDFRSTDYTVVKEGSTYPLSINLGTSGGDLARYKVYMDYNNSGTFEESEIIFAGTSTSSAIVTLSQNITIPNASVKNRMLTMRVITSTGYIASACSDVSVPDVEDYGVMIVGNCNTETMDFESDKIMGCSNTTIKFIDKSCIPFSTNFSNYTYQWIFTSGVNSYTSTEQYPSINFIQTGVYNATLNITTPSGVKTITKENYIKINEAPIIVCNSITSTDGQNSRNVNRVVFNTIDKQTSTSINEGYQDFRCTNTTLVKAGQTYPLTISINSTSVYNLERFKAYLDYNNDGVFANTEMIFEGKASVEYKIESFTKNILIPNNSVKNTLLTLRVIGNAEDINSSCGSFKNADIEDYGILIENNGNSETIDFESDQPVGYINTNIKFIDKSIFPYTTNFNGTAYTYQWTFSNGTKTYTSTIHDPSIVFDEIGIYNATLIINTPTGIKTLVKENYIRIIETPLAVCTISPSSGTWANRAISKVVFNTISKQTPSTINEVYKDFRTTDNTIVKEGFTYPLTINIGTTNNDKARYKVYIDYNYTGTFDETEVVFSGTFSGTSSAYASGVVSKDISIPTNAVKNKLLTMRVMTAVSDIPTACSAITVPDVEDYGVMIIGYTAAPIGTASQNSCAGKTIADLAATGTNIKWYANAAWGTALASNTRLINATTYYASQTVNGLESTDRFAVTAQLVITPLPVATVTAQPTCTLATGTITVGSSTTGLTFSIDGTDYNNTSGIFTGALAGTYSLTAKNTIGCISAVTSVTVNAQPTTPVALTVNIAIQSTCAINTGTVALTGLPSSGNWTVTATGGAIVTGTGTTGNFSGLAAGTYSFTVSNGTCSSVASTNVTVNPQPQTPPAPSASVLSQPTCSTNTGQVELTGLPASGNWTVTASGVATLTGTGTSGTFGALAAGTYAFTVSNGTCTSPASSSVTLNHPPQTPTAPTASVSSQPNCAVVTGTITVSSPTSGSSFSIDGTDYNNTSGVFSLLIAGNYSITEKNTAGCASGATIVTVNAQPAPAVAPIINVTQPTCAISTGIIQVTSNGITGDTYSIDGSTYQASTLFNSVASGTYSITVISASGCISAAVVGVVNVQPTVLTIPTVTASSTSPVCAGTEVVLTSNSVSGNQWYNNGTAIAGATSQTYSTSLGGSFTVITSNESSCSNSASVPFQLTIKAKPTATIAQGAQLAFVNCATTSLTLTAATDASNAAYQWHLDGLPINFATNATLSATAAGNYSVLVAANGCSNTSAYTKIVSTPSVSVTGSTNVCEGMGVLLSTNTSGSNYQWRVNTGSGYANVPNGGTGASYNAQISGDYQIIIDANATSCPITITVNPLPSATISIAPSASLCAGASTTLTAVSGNSFNYQWSTSGVNIASATSAAYRTQTSGEYSVKVTDNNGCSFISVNTIISVNPSVTIPVIGTITQPTCTAETATAVLNGLPSGNWTITPSVGLAVNGTGSSFTFSDLVAATSYTFTVTNSFGCISQATASIVVHAQPTTPAAPSVNITQPACSTTSGIITVSGNAGDAFSINGNNYQLSNVFNVGVGTYSVTSRNENGCISASTSVVVNAQYATPDLPTAIVSAQPTCATATGTITVNSATAGLTFSINGSNYNNSNGVFTGVSPSIYLLTARDANGCTSAAISLTVNTQPASPTTPSASIGLQPTCFTNTGSVTLSGLPSSGSWTVTATGGATLSGSGSSATFSDLAAGAYTFTVFNGTCISVVSSSVTVNTVPETPIAPSAVVSIQPTCTIPTGTVALSGLPANGSWTVTASSGEIVIGTGTTGTFSGLDAGVFTFTVSNGTCLSIESSSITINTQPISPLAPIASVTVQPTCNQASGTILVASSTTGLTFSIDGSTYTNSNGIFAAVYPATYDLTARNASGCISAVKTVTVNAQPLSPSTILARVSIQPICATQTGTVELSGLPATGNWTVIATGGALITGSGANGSFTGLAEGRYTFTVSNGTCSSIASTSITVVAQSVNPLPPIAAVTIQPNCTIFKGTIAVSSSMAGLTFSIDGTNYNNSNGVFTGIDPGTYNLTSKNTSGCTSAEVSITVDAPPATSNNSITLSSDPSSNNQIACINTSITNITYKTTGATGATFSGLQSNVTGSWANNVATISGINNVNGAFNYTITLTGGCGNITTSGTIAAIPNNTIKLSTSAGSDNQTNCTNMPITPITYSTWGATAATFSGLPDGVTGKWSADIASISGTPTVAGRYNYKVNLSGGCGNITATGTIIAKPIASSPLITAGNNSFCPGGSMILNSSAFTGNQWYKDGNIITGAINTTFAANSIGNYRVSNYIDGCTSYPSAPKIITSRNIVSPPIITASGTTSFCVGGNVSLSSNLETGIQWRLNGSDIAGATYPLYTSSVAGNFTVLVTENGCTSDAITVKILASPNKPIVAAMSATSFCMGGNVILNSNEASGNRWYKDGLNIAGATGISHTVSMTGAYTDTVINSLGCKSGSLPTIVTVREAPNKPVIFWNGSDLSTNSSADAFQWSVNNVALFGATQSAYSPLTIGLYKIQITNSDGCNSTSENFNLVVTALNNPATSNVSNLASVFPNPSTLVLLVKFREVPNTTLDIRLITSDGRTVQLVKTKDKLTSIPINHLPSGKYYVSITGKQYNQIEAVIIDK